MESQSERKQIFVIRRKSKLLNAAISKEKIGGKIELETNIALVKNGGKEAVTAMVVADMTRTRAKKYLRFFFKIEGDRISSFRRRFPRRSRTSRLKEKVKVAALLLRRFHILCIKRRGRSK